MALSGIHRIRLSGFADEAADGIDAQIEVLRELGWKGLEARSIDGKNLHDLEDEAFLRAAAALDKAGIQVNCLGSTIANWGRPVDEDFAASLSQVDRAIRRMKALGTPMVRIMSYALIFDGDGRPAPDQRKELRFARLREICSRFLAEGIVPVHENCLNYGGLGWKESLELLEQVPGLKLVFDTGNPGLTPDFRFPEPYPNQDPLEAWEKLKQAVVHIHLKDGFRNPESGAETYVYPGEGGTPIKPILRDLLARGYEGWISIEPHMAAVFHDASRLASPTARREIFLEYGRRTEALLRSLGCEVSGGEAVYRPDFSIPAI